MANDLEFILGVSRYILRDSAFANSLFMKKVLEDPHKVMKILSAEI